ncbi:MAG: hypothetical protein ACR2MS_06735 [Weeksellaceae bacterium]
MKNLGKKSLILCVVSGLITLSACKKETETKVEETTPVEETQVTTDNSTEGVTIEDQQKEEDVQVENENDMGSGAIETKVVGENIKVHLEKVQTVGQILMVEFLVEQEGFELQGVDASEINIIDDATSKTYGLLKDDAGNYMGSPKAIDDSEIDFNKGRISLKFPALPAESKTVSITVPKVGTFNGITIQK